jgi:hypothetical protein
VIPLERKVVREAVDRFMKVVRAGRRRYGPDAMAFWGKAGDYVPLRTSFGKVPKVVQEEHFVSSLGGFLDRIKLTTPWGAQRTVYIHFTAGDPTDPKLHGTMWGRRQRRAKKGNGIVPFVTVNYPYDLTWKQLEQRRFRLEEVLAHELTHALDWAPWVTGKQKGKGHTAYLNRPIEVRANLRGVHTEIAPLLGIEKLVRPGKSFRYYFNKALAGSSVWRGIEKHLTPRNRSYILKNLYQELEGEYAGLGSRMFAEALADKRKSRA